MNPVWLMYLVLSTWVSTPRPFQIQFAHSAVGQNVVVCIDGETVEQTFAGKMTFRDERHSWQSVCADVRSPVAQGQVFTVTAFNSKKVGGNVEKAGNIVAKYFKSAQTPDQCAGLQIAVWKALEDGEEQPDFSSGRLQVRASQSVLNYAYQYYQAISTPGQAAYIATGGGPSAAAGAAGGGGGQSQLSTLT